MADEKVYYFVDTREDAKSKAKFGIHNADTAKAWTRDFNNGEGPFKPVKEKHEDFQINRRDLQEAELNETPLQIEATKHNMELLAEEGDNPYKDMSPEELKAELDAREIKYKKSGPQATSEEYVKQLLVDDEKE